jgi:polysaccharide biosynthesis protein PslG
MTKGFAKIWAVIIVLVLAGGASGAAYWAFLRPAPEAAQTQITTVAATNPKIGVHTRLTDEVEGWKIDKTFEMAREMGSSWAVEYFPWNYIEGAGPGQYDWSHSDAVIEAANRQGLKLVARLDGVPAWARPAKTTGKYLDYGGYGAFGEFVNKFVDRYKGKVKYYIIWNEPNLSSEWGQRQVDPAGYTELLKVAYARAKEADPSCIVMAAGLAPTLEPQGSEWGLDDLEYLKQMYQAGAGKYFDMLAVHAYGLKSSPEETPDPAKINFARVELDRQIMEQNGDGGKQIMITEGGWNDNPRWVNSVRPYQRIEYTVEAYDMAAKDWNWLEAVNIWAFRFPKPANGYSDYYTFVTPDFVPKPIYLEVQKYATAGTSQQAMK